MASKSINISVIDEPGTHIELFKIIPYSDGGFGIVLPRLTGSQTGRLEKTVVNYKKYGTKLHINRDENEQYSAKDIVKFSYHSDGFVQFSSTTNNRIISGRNNDGTPKGLGLMSWPVDQPISTGPSITISFWGLSGFRKARHSRIDGRYLFETKTAIDHPKAKFRAMDKSAYAMALYLIPVLTHGEIIDIDGRKHAHLTMMQSLPDGGSFMRLRELVRVVELPNHSFRIMISWFRIPNRFKAESGYIFFGPTDGKRGLAASYPNIEYGSNLLMKDLSYS